MNHMWKMLQLAGRTALPRIGISESVTQSDPNETNEIESKAENSKDSEKKKLEAKDKAKDATELEEGDDNDSLSSLSFYDDFPKLYFAVRRGRYAKNSVFLSWESAREHIVGYPDAEYIATPTLEQAHKYTNGFGEFDNTINEDQNDSSQRNGIKSSRPLSATPSEPLPSQEQVLSEKEQKTTLDPPEVRQRKRKYTTRKLLLEYYECYDPGYKAKGKKPLTIPIFLKEREMFKDKFKVFAKHWQRSGLLMMCNEEKPLEQAVYKYDSWVRDRKLEKLGIDPLSTIDERTNGDKNVNNEKAGKKRKRQRPVVVLSNGSSNHKNDIKMAHSPDSNGKNHVDKTPDSNKKNNPPSKKRKKRSPANPALRKPSTRKANAKRRKNRNNPAVSPIDTTVLDNVTTTTNPLHYNNPSEEEEDDIDEQFNTMYEKLKEYHSQHGHCKVKKSKHPELAYFVNYTRRRMQGEATRFGARALTLREEKLLNDLDFDPVYKEIVTEFNKYLGMRVAKLFDVVMDGEDSDEVSSSSSMKVSKQKGVPNIKRVPFFGTVGRISSVSNRYLRIKYDDGDSEDFDIDCLKEGLELYEKYKHKDTLRSEDKIVPSTTTSEPGVAKKNADTNDVTCGDKAGKSDKGRSQGNDNLAGIDSNKTITPTKTKSSNMPDRVSSGEIGKNIEATNSDVHNNAINTASNAEQGKLPESTITPETNAQSPNVEAEMRDSDHSSINKLAMNGDDDDDNDDNDDNDLNGSTGNGDDDDDDDDDDENDNDNEDENENDSDNDSSSSDEVEIVGVMVPYRGNPGLLGFADAGGDGAMYYDNNGNSANNPFSIYEEGVYDF